MSKRSPVGASAPRSAADWFYFELETFLDNWRRHGMPEAAVRAALDRAQRASLAMESVARRLNAHH